MNIEEIIEMARQAGMAYEEKLEVYVANIDDLQDFAKLVAAKEREACLNCYSPDDTASDWSDKIRARGDQ